ncbi:MAG TPA: hypothetical protein VKU01_14610 [Bryobacteraceae bacterium]|nr:hypothetical protein [Bryobacteraceae bacterium]
MKALRFALPAGLILAAVLTFPPAASGRIDPRDERIARVVSDCDARADEFQRMFRRALDHSGYRGTMRQADLDRHADALSHAMRRVREAWNRERDPRRTRRYVEEAIDVSRDINRVMNNNRFYPELHHRWDALRHDLNRLAEEFELPRLRWD